MTDIKKIFFIVALLMLIIGLSSAASAADDTTTDSIISETPTDTSVEEVTTPTSSDTTIKNNNKIINKTTQENVKTATKTVEVNDFTELTAAMNGAVQDTDNEEYVINLNEGTYNLTNSQRFNGGTAKPNIIINGNQQNLVTSSKANNLILANGCNVTFKNIILNQNLTIQNSANTLTIINSTLNSTLKGSGDLIVDDNTMVDNGFVYSFGGNIYTNNTAFLNKVEEGGYYFNGGNIDNKNITVPIRNYGNMIINNSNTVALLNYGNLTVINTTITKGSLTYGTGNYGNLTFIDSTINFKIENRDDGKLIFINSSMNDQISEAGSTNIKHIEFINSTSTKQIVGRNTNLLVNNSTMYQIKNNGENGTITLTNMELANIYSITNQGTLVIRDDVIIAERANITTYNDYYTKGARLMGNGVILCNNTYDLIPFIEDYNGTYVMENMTISVIKRNCGNLTIRNTTLNQELDNTGNLTICDDVIFGENCKIYESEPGIISINNTQRMIPYIYQYNGDYVVENETLDARTNNGNLTIRNSTLNERFTNNGNLTIENCTLNNQIANSGTLIISTDVILGSAFSISGDGDVICDDSALIAPYLPTYNGDFLLENMTITSVKTNNGKLTIRNCTIQARITNNGNLTIEDSSVHAINNNGNITIENSTLTQTVTNNGNLTLKNCTVNQRITNKGFLTIEDDVIFGPNFSITGSGHIYANDMAKLFPYIQQFYEEATVELGTYTKAIANYGKLTIENSTLTGLVQTYANAEMILRNTTTTNSVTNRGRLELNNATINSTISNGGTLIISDDTILGANFKITGNGEVIINDTQRVADYLSTYTGNIVLTNKTINANKVNNGNLTLNDCTITAPIINNKNITLNNCTITAIITNNGQITIDENTVFSENGKIAGNGEIITDNITRILPYIDTINGNYTITDTTLNKTYVFKGNITLNNCTITSQENDNLGTLYLNDCTVDVGEENIFLNNLGTLYVDKNTKITGQIENIGGETNFEPTYEPKTIVVTNKTLKYYFDAGNGGKLSDLVNPGDTLDFQGAIGGVPNLNNLCVNKPVNIISTTKDAYVCLNTTNGDLSGSNPGNMFSINKDGSYTNVTGIYFFNTQLWLYNTDHVILDNISAVVDNQSVGSGVGQTSIRANSTYITVKNSYFFTRNNGGSSTLVLAYANYCTIVNNTIVGGGGCGNLLYLTTYNVDVPRDVVYNSYNVLANNTLEMMSSATSICWGIVLSGSGNLVDNNTLTFNGTGINFQWGSGSGSGEGAGLYNISDNIISNNKLYGTSSIAAGDVIYNNYVPYGTITVNNAIAYNNTAAGIGIDGQSTVKNNTVNGNLAISKNAKPSLVENNIINGNISIPSDVSNFTFIQNNITGTITLDGSGNVFTDNRIISEEEYTIESRRTCKENVIRDNYLLSAENAGDESVKLKDASNIIENNIPINTNIEIITSSETTVNTTTPVIIIVTRKDQLTTEDITITVNNENETVTAKNGIILIQYTPTEIGNQEITATFNGHDDYMTSTSTATIKVTPDKDAIIEELNNTVQQASKDCVLTIDTIPDIKFNDNLTIYGKLIDTKGTGISGEKITVNVNGADSKVTTDANGVWKLKIKTTTLGTNNVTATYNGTAYNPYTTSTTFQIAQTEAIITIDKIVTTQFRDNVTITGTFKNSNGKAIANSKVRVNVNGYSTYVTTDHDGVWSLTIKTNKTGVNNVTASFSGNANYAKYTANATFNVTKQDLIITTEVKYNKGNFTITGTFVDKNGNKLSNSKIRVNINGKAVYVKTDSNGTYTYSELVTAKTIKYNVYYGGSANYNSYTSSKTTLTVA